jgi:hypothetical protein
VATPFNRLGLRQAARSTSWRIKPQAVVPGAPLAGVNAGAPYTTDFGAIHRG